MLKPEEINGKMYQPVESAGKENYDCDYCCFNSIPEECELARCLDEQRPDGLEVHYINIEGE